MSRRWIGALALSLTVGGVLAPSAAHAATTASATVTASSPVHDELATYTLAVAGFEPGTDSVGLDISVNGQPYGLNYDQRRNIASDGTGSWSWPWSHGDPYGTYVFTFTDHAGHSAAASVTITHSATAPTPPAGTSLMIDTISAPPLDTVQAWQSAGAPYDAIGVYLPVDPTVDNRGDHAQVNLLSTWVSAVESGGWHVVPIHVGLQAPESCQRSKDTYHEMSADPATAQAQGEAAAQSAAASSADLRINSTYPVIADIEPYGSGCSAAVQAYLAGWTNELHRLHRHAGVYGTPGSVAKDLADAHAADPAYVLPEVVWAATDNHRVSTSVSNLPTATWKVANQYLLDIERSYGDQSPLTIDESAVDDAVWSLPPVASGTDATAPVITPGRAPWLVRAGSATFTWAGVDADSGLARYEVRSRHTAAGRGTGPWGRTSSLAASPSGRTSLPVRPGEQVCLEVRAVDEAGNRSAWTAPACSTRLLDDRAAKAAGGWKRARQGSAYGRTISVASRKGAVLTLGTASAGTQLGVVRSGRGPLTVAVNGRKVATLTGEGTRAVVLPRSGKVTLTSASSRKVTVDGYVLAPRPRP